NRSAALERNYSSATSWMVSTDYQNAITHAMHYPALRDWMMEKFDWTASDFDNINFDAIESSFATSCTWSAKHATSLPLCAQACEAQAQVAAQASLGTEAILLRGYLVKEWTPAIAKHYRRPPAPANDPFGTHTHPTFVQSLSMSSGIYGSLFGPPGTISSLIKTIESPAPTHFIFQGTPYYHPPTMRLESGCLPSSFTCHLAAPHEDRPPTITRTTASIVPGRTATRNPRTTHSNKLAAVWIKSHLGIYHQCYLRPVPEPGHFP
ncbi:hypothetical protein THAOC_29482, partial [Thalassiosira oceanica]